jgi:RES domain-containing protein
MWSFSPLSGEGAAIHGGRFNPRGVPALYLSLTIDGAVAEATQGFAAKLEPLVICLYEVDCEDVLDLSTENGRAAVDVSPTDMASPWAFDRSNGTVPASWTLARRLITQGCAGIVVPSFARHARAGTRNLVLWRWGSEFPHRVSVHDPSGRLPKNQLSWDKQ